MIRRPRMWMAVAVLFTLVNVAGGVYAAVIGEVLHCLLHVVLTLVGGLWILLLARGRAASGIQREGAAGVTGQRSVFGDQLANLEQSLDAVAVEVERIGESQRFMTRRFTEQGGLGKPVANPAEPGVGGIRAGETPPPNVRRD